VGSGPKKQPIILILLSGIIKEIPLFWIQHRSIVTSEQLIVVDQLLEEKYRPIRRVPSAPSFNVIPSKWAIEAFLDKPLEWK
jgi:hypothetical protein